MTNEVQNRQWNHRHVFLRHNAEPFICAFCDEEVIKSELLVHHIDEDHGNDDPDNLVAMHHGCHTSHHKRGTTYDDAAKYNMSVAHIGNRVANSKLSERDVMEIRYMYAKGYWTYKEIAKMYNVSEATIGCAIRGDLYGWVK
jgi:hypothetical protein